MTRFAEAVIAGLGDGSAYALIALGFVIIYKSTRVISFAQPALVVSGAVTTSYLVPLIGLSAITGLSFFVSVLAAALITATIALVIERLAIRPMVGKEVFAIAIITIGIDIAIRAVANGFIGTGARPVRFPWGIETVEVFGLRVQIQHLTMMVSVAVVILLLLWFFRFTRYGLAMRAAAFDQEAAMTQGVSVGAVFAMSWGIAGALAAIAGSLLAIETGVEQTTWLVALVALPAIILGGLDSLPGAVVGGLLVGVTQAVVGTYHRDLVPSFTENLGGIAPYILMLLVLLIRPYGIFGTPEVRRV